MKSVSDTETTWRIIPAHLVRKHEENAEVFKHGALRDHP